MWLGELITDRGVGNGMSLMIFTQVIAVVPGQLYTDLAERGHVVIFTLVLGVGVLIVAAVAFMEQAQRRIPGAVRQANGRPQDVRRHVDLHPAQGQPGGRYSGHLRLVAADDSRCSRRTCSAARIRRRSATGWATWIQTRLVKGDDPIYMVSFFILIILFTYFYVSITFNPDEVADNMKKSGGFIPGIRPGGPTAGYLRFVLNRLTAPGSVTWASSPSSRCSLSGS